jgi:hypothetical protein
MTKSRSDTDSRSPPGGDAPAKPGRVERLSAALRANLARRKVQARARKGAWDEPSAGDGEKPRAADQPADGPHDSAGFVGEKRTRR